MQYIKYQTFIKYSGMSESSNLVPENMYHAQQIGFKKLQKYILNQNENNLDKTKTNIDEINLNWLKSKLNIKKTEELTSILSPEQMDSVCIAIYNIENNQEFIIGDETGIGKGRILASICRYAFFNNKKTLFFTEGSHLFTDFWRDIINTNTDKYIHKNGPFLLHGNASIYSNKNEKIFKNPSKTILSNILESGLFEFYDKKEKKHDFSTNQIMTTYSQFNRIVTAKNKIKLINNYFKENNTDTIVIFDEFHNSIGESTTKEKKDEIIKLGGHPIYSSATFLDDYKQILSFKNILNLQSKDNKVIDTLYKSKSKELKNQIAFKMTSNLMLLRREHEEVQKTTYIEIDENSKKVLEINTNIFRKIIFMMFDCYQIIEKTLLQNNMEKKKLKNKWIEFGGKINRLSKTLLLLSKKDFLINRIEKSIESNQKVVIILDSTFESLIQTSFNYNKTIEFKTLLKNIAEETFNDYLNLNNEIKTNFQNLINEIDKYPYLSLAFIDDIKKYFKENNKSILEISGRTTEVVYEENNVAKIVTLKQEDKPIVINKFNNDVNNNILIITRSASTGASLHSSKDFIDQKQRKMIEPEITPRVKVRNQFKGRVNRRGQVNKPEFESITSGLLFEKRIIALEENKNRNMKAFIGSDYEIESIDYDYYNDDIDHLAKLYLLYHPEITRKLGIYIYSDEPYYFIDTLLKRSILLNSKEQTDFFDYLDSGHDIYLKAFKQLTASIKNSYTENLMISHVKELWGNLSESEKIELNKLNKKEKLDSELPMTYLVKAFNEIQLNKVNENELKEKLEHNKKILTKEKYLNCVDKVINKQNFQNKNIYENNKIIEKNYLNIKKTYIGQQIKFKLNGNVFFGYVENIEINNPIYTTHYLYTIKLINPIYLNENSKECANYVFIPGNVLLENESFDIYGEDINFDKFIRNNEIVKQNMFFIMGNMFYVNYIMEVYKLGSFISFNKEIDNEYKQYFAIKLPNNLNENKVLEIFNKLPIVTIQDLENKLKNGVEINTYNNELIIKLIKNKMNYKENYWKIKIHKNIYANENIFGYMEKKILKEPLKNNDYLYFEIKSYYEYKKIITTLFYNESIHFVA